MLLELMVCDASRYSAMNASIQQQLHSSYSFVINIDFAGAFGLIYSDGSLAQLDRVLAFEARCCRFESCRGRQNPREIKYLSKTSVKNVKNPKGHRSCPKHRKTDDLVNLPIAKRVLGPLAKKDLIAW